MGTTTYPVPSSGSSTSTVLPVNASSVLLDGALTSATSYTTTINGNGGLAYLVAGDNPATFTVGGNSYTVPANTVSATTTAVGSSSSVTVKATSPAPTSWSIGYPGFAYGSAAWNGTTYVVGGNGNTVLSGTSPSSLSAYTPFGSSSSRTTVAYMSTPGYFVAIDASYNNGSATPYNAYSSNGTTWTAGTIPTKAWSAIASNGTNLAVAVAGGGAPTNSAAYTSIGTYWSGSTMPSSAYWNWVAYSNGYFVAGGQSTTNAYSSNGSTWTACSALNTYSGADNGSGTMVVINASSSTAYLTTNHLVSYSTITLSSATCNSITYGSGWWFAYSPTGSNCYSSNGTTWTNLASFNSGGGGANYSICGFANNTFFAGATSDLYYATSSTLMPVNFGIYAGPTTIH